MFNLNDKYTRTDGKFILSGIQAVVKLSLLQKKLDKRKRLNTAGYITGYRGSPLGGVDKEFMAQETLLAANNIKFKAAINEDLGVAAIQGTQQLGILSPSKIDGVFGIWYGKGPGVDRSGDQFRHTSFFGTAKYGGALVIAGDDHANKSSVIPHETGPAFATWNIPVINPATVEDLLRLGLLGIGLSRYSGLFCAVKVITNIADAFQTVEVNLNKWKPVIPNKKFDVNIRWPEDIQAERRIFDEKLPAVQEFLKHNKFNEITHNAPNKKLGIITVGKSHVDTLTALQKHNIVPEKHGISILKIGMSWPLQEDLVKKFCLRHKEILVIEEKSPFVEDQIYKLLYGYSYAPRIYGKNLLTCCLDFDSYDIARALSKIIDTHNGSESTSIYKVIDTVKFTNNYDTIPQIEARSPWYCSGCPHNTSTALPAGSKALIGIGCHYMAQFMPDRPTETLMPMGAEGINWLGQYDHQEADHIFVNLGDGTYFHSGILAIRQAVASDANMTYKILYNDAVAMTGGQKVDGLLTVAMVCQQVLAEGVKDVSIVSDNHKKWKGKIPKEVKLYPKEKFDEVQTALTKVKGITVLVYDQQCATEKRREIKRGIQKAPSESVWINPDVCENCGDCSTQSNCLSIVPVETMLGTKRRIDQDSCNYSYDCLDGFCPSFITVKGKRISTPVVDINLPNIKKRKHSSKIVKPKRYNILLAGVGGTGIISLSQIISVAAHLDGLKVVATDQTGLAQKYGAVTSTISIGSDAHGKMYPGTADLVVGTDPQVSTTADVMRFISKNTFVLLNSKPSSTGKMIEERDWKFDVNEAKELLQEHSKELYSFNAYEYAKKLTGYALMVNMIMLGYAYEKCLLPIREISMLKAIESNGTLVDANKKAWKLGRHLAIASDKEKIDTKISNLTVDESDSSTTQVDHRFNLLKEYQNKEYATLYHNLIREAQLKDFSLGKTEFSNAVMTNLYKLMAYKDEYEVARLWDENLDKIGKEFSDIKGVNFHMSLPWQRKSKKKTRLPGYTQKLFTILKHGKKLRGTKFDLFGYTHERKLEREIRDYYIKKVRQWIDDITKNNYKEIVAQAKQPDSIRGYGHIKLDSISNCELFKSIFDK